MTTNKNDHVVIAFFADANAADEAIEALKNWDKADDEIKLGSIGMILRENDKVKIQIGRNTGKGASVGAVLGIIAGVLSGGMTVIGGVIGGGALGGIIGTFFKKTVGLTKEEIDKIGAELDAGRVAVVVACDDFEVAPTSIQLTSFGGTVQEYAVPEEAMTEAAEAMAAANIIPGETPIEPEPAADLEATSEKPVDDIPPTISV